MSINSQLYSSFSLRNYIEFKEVFSGVEKIFARTCLLMTFLCSAGQGLFFGRIGRQALRKSLLRTATVVNGGRRKLLLDRPMQHTRLSQVSLSRRRHLCSARPSPHALRSRADRTSCDLDECASPSPAAPERAPRQIVGSMAKLEMERWERQSTLESEPGAFQLDQIRSDRLTCTRSIDGALRFELDGGDCFKSPVSDCPKVIQ